MYGGKLALVPLEPVDALVVDVATVIPVVFTFAALDTSKGPEPSEPVLATALPLLPKYVRTE